MTSVTTIAGICRDADGQVLSVGDPVRVVAIDPGITVRLSAREKRDIESMIGEVFEIVSFGHGVAYVEKQWQRGADRWECHKIPLWPEQMIRVMEESVDR